MSALDALYLLFLFTLCGFGAYEILCGLLQAWLRRHRVQLEDTHEPQPDQRAAQQMFGTRRATNAVATLGAVIYVLILANALTTPGWLPVLLMGNLVFGLTVTALRGVTAGTLHRHLRVRDRIWFRLVHALLWPLHLLRGRRT